MKKPFVGIVLLILAAGCSSAQSAQPTAIPTVSVKRASVSGASAQGYVVPVQHADLAFRISGRAAQVFVSEGAQVKAGQKLVQLQDAELAAALAIAQAELKSLQNGARAEEIAQAQANLNIAQAQLEAAQAELERLQSGALAAQLAAARADVARAAAELKVAQDSYDALVLGPGYGIPTDLNVPGRGLGAYEENKRAQLAATKAAYDAAQQRFNQVQVSTSASLQATQAAVEAAAAQRSAAQARLNLLKAGAPPQQIEAAQARVAQAQAALNEATLVAPFDGTVIEMLVNVGEVVAPGIRIASIANLSQWQVETDDLKEMDVVNVQPGAEATIKVDALSGVPLRGKVVSITPRSEIKRGEVTYTVKVAIIEPDPRLKWGMTAYVDIQGK